MKSLFASTVLFGEDILNSIHIFAGSWLDYLMLGITWTGSAIFYMMAIPVLYWCWDRRRALYIGAVYLTAMTVNDSLKCFFNHPRPDQANLLPGIQELATRHMPRGPGFPSGHAQGAVGFWGSILAVTGNKTVKTVCVAMIIIVSYSRLYLGVHYLGDILGGLVLGILCIVIVIPASFMAEKHYRSISPIIAVAILLIIPVIIYIIVPGHYLNTTMGAASGFLIGALLAEERIQFNPRNRIPCQVAKITIGITVLAAIRFGLRSLLPDSAAAGFFRYWCIGFWCSFGAPYVFGKIKVLRGEKERV